MVRIIDTLAEVANDYDAVFCDLWGCLHNGISAFPEAVEALRAFRADGGKVVLLTNAPRPRADVEKQLDGMGVPRDCWDTIATSGDSARAAMFRGVVGNKVWFMGEERDLTFFEPIKLVDDPVEIERVPLDQAEGIVCLGAFDAQADPAVNRPEFLYAKTKGLKLLCANPDIVVDRGDTREWCAGALAQLYTEMGGESLYFGKPHPPVYDLARRRLSELGTDISDNRILAIGDGINTDIRGALGEDLDSLFITGGLAAAETRTDRQPDPQALEEFVSGHQIAPTFAMGFLR
ncbi:TIGR01459 family HAD-type hydrolase [Alphaproteobacteria bacterium GH1-50]|uniref:TIGR01459 family HAD-type hydrolase n=1 Tax=Kangsaoukella pontilimi TaxID=2691042 RepID=A0A7C9MX24_9RHOB|nr:TIGR01459 family HAD-type hydrolase [Kangsaoukella pontilimi]MXQ08074.1 TIGR01459 family HAD-type hydrolase [Kangsaoukella pontilimi]